MAHQPYLYLKLLLRDNLLLDLDEYALNDTRQHGLVCSFMGMRLASVFQPILGVDGKVAGREALLRAGLLEHGELAPDAAFEDAVRANRLVQFDRLVRTIHLLNHTRKFNEYELLFLNVHSHLLTGVSDHGRTFEQILHYYSTPTARVVIEIKEHEVKDDARLAEAVSNYRSLGYRIAVSGFGTAHSSLERVLKLQPDIVKMDGALIHTADNSCNAASSLNKLVNRFHSEGVQVAINGIETARQLRIARLSGASLLQGYYLGHPEFSVEKKIHIADDSFRNLKVNKVVNWGLAWMY